MNVERFLYQVQQNLPKHEGVTVWIDDSAVKVRYGDTGSFEIGYRLDGKGPEPSGRDFNMPYKLLAEFNGVVLGGIEYQSRCRK